jgi:cytochrome c553
MALPRRERLLILVVVLAFLAVLPGCSDSKSESLDTPFPNWAEQQGFTENAEAIDGAKIFARVGCAQCHTYLGYGASNVGAPDLSSIGKDSNRSIFLEASKGAQ